MQISLAIQSLVFLPVGQEIIFFDVAGWLPGGPTVVFSLDQKEIQVGFLHLQG